MALKSIQNLDTARISLIIPTLNEEGNIQHLVERIDAALTPAGVQYELVFIDDHSSDSTRDIITRYAETRPVRLYLKQGMRGKGYSIVEGFSHVQYPLTGIIDADLQYPPEALPEMIHKIVRGQADFVIADRDERNLDAVRKFFSKGFKFFFGKLLHGFNGDVQSGLKVFRTQIIREVTLNPSGWAWDLELTLGARDLGWKIDWVRILFAQRTAGVSTLNVFQAAYEIGTNAIRMKFRSRIPQVISPTGETGMIGAGIAKNGQRFITHSVLSPDISALYTFTPGQRLFFGAIAAGIGIGLWLDPVMTGITILGLLSLFYFIDALFQLILVLRSLHRPPELAFSPSEIAKLTDSSLPMYTVLCPLFREAHVLPGFITAMENLDWPKDKLDVMLLLEENDPETIRTAQFMNLPAYVRIIVVPHSLPKTKPKACNYGLSLARGEYLVIYDAEDVPATDQLKKAYLAFQALPSSVKCLQGKLNYFNSEQNLLTRLFTAEYSLWFDVMLPGLQSMNTTIPLGGTSNHFRTADLRDLKGWDPFNVTEDADLGTRLFAQGYTTAIIDSTTLEEANSNLKNWIRQRSRWIKGYMQTYLVHMRRPLTFFKRSPLHFFLFQLNIGGKIAVMLINPILWATTISYFAFRATVGPIVEQLYPSIILYIGVASLVFGNFLYLYYYMIGCAKRGHWHLMKYVFFIPFYWLAMAVAAGMALYELIVRPHYWQKTNHGLHLAQKSVPPRAEKPVPAPASFVASPTGERRSFSGVFARWWDAASQHSLVSRGGILISAMVVSNALNFLFSAFIGRTLALADMGLVTLINTLWYVAGIFIGGVSSTINHRTSYLSAREGVQASVHFWKVTVRLALTVAVFASLAWLIAIPFLSQFFHIEDRVVLLLFTPALMFGVWVAANRGFLQGNLMFQSTALVYVTEALSKLMIALALVYAGLGAWVFLAIPGSVVAAALVAALLSYRIAQGSLSVVTREQRYEFPKFFYAASIMSSISSAVFLSLDIILVKHYLPPVMAGEYALLALVGKMIYFLGSMPAVFMITLVSRAQGLGRDARKTFHAILSVTFAMVVIGFTALGWFGDYFVPLLLGDKTRSILHHLLPYTAAISLFTLTNVIVSYHLAKKQYIFPIASLAISILMAIGIILNHAHIGDIVTVISGLSVGSLMLLGAMHVFEKPLKYVSTNTLDFIGAFMRAAPIPRPAGGKRVLIFNWRDIRHALSGGAEVYVHEIAKRLAEQGNYVTIFCGNDGLSPRNEIVDGVHVIRRGGFYFVYLWAFVYYFTQFRGRYDLIIDTHNGIPFFTTMYVKEPVICVFFHVHQEVFRRLLPAPLASLACFLERDIMPLAYKNVHFVTISPSSRDEMIRFGLIGRGIEIVYSGIDLNAFKPAAKSPRPMVLYLGRLKAYKSVGVLVTAFKLLTQRVPDAMLVIAGSGEEDAHLKRLAFQLGLLNGQIFFTGKISENDKVDLLQKAWVMVNPSFMEGWGITTIEANACGTPVIGADVPGLRDSIRDFETGYLVPHGDSQGFADKIAMVIEDTKLREQLSRKSLQWAQNFSWDRTVQNLLAKFILD